MLEKGWDQKKPHPVQPGAFNGRVLFALHNSLPLDGAGYAIRSHQIIKHLLKKGLEVQAVTRPGYPWDLEQHRNKPLLLEDIVDGVGYKRLQGKGLELGTRDIPYINGYANLLSSMAKQGNFRVIHTHSNYLNGLAGTLAAQKSCCLGIYEARGLWHQSRGVMEPGFEDTDLYRYLQSMELAAARQAHMLVTISQALKDYFIGQGINQNRITVVPNAVDTDLFQPLEPDAALKAQFKLKGRIVVGFIGSLTDYEGIDLIIRSASRLINEGLPLSLLIVGAGYAEKGLKKMATASGASRHISFTGKVPFEQIRRYYSIVDIFPFPRKNLSVCRLVPPLKILEAMAMNKAVIVSDLPPLTEIVTHEKTGLVCNPDDPEDLAQAIRTLADSPDFKKNIGQRAGEWIYLERSWNQIAGKYMKIYECN